MFLVLRERGARSLGWKKTLDADLERAEDPYLGEVLGTAAPLALSAHLLDRCIVSRFHLRPLRQL